MWEVYLNEEQWIILREMSGFWERFIGLMGKSKDTLEQDGLWFPDCHSIHTCFMKFPLDLYFLDGNHTILQVNTDVQSGRFVGKRGADSVVEIPSGAHPLAEVGQTLKFVSCK